MTDKFDSTGNSTNIYAFTAQDHRAFAIELMLKAEPRKNYYPSDEYVRTQLAKAQIHALLALGEEFR